MKLKVLKYFALIIGSLLLRVALGQPVLRLSGQQFMEAVSSHPEIQVKQGEQGKQAKIEFKNEFRRQALETFHRCWMLEQQIGEALRFHEKIVAMRVNDTELLMKQQLMLTDNNRKRKDLQSEYTETVAQVNDLVSHMYGEQTVLPESSVWPEFKLLVEDGKHLSDSFTDMNKLVALQEKVITLVSTNDVTRLMNELNRLETYKGWRWRVFESIVKSKADIFEMNGTMASGKQL